MFMMLPDSFVPNSSFVCSCLLQLHWQDKAAIPCCACITASLACKSVLACCRAKYGESAFLEVYQKLYEAPDPSAVLVNAAVSPPFDFGCILQLYVSDGKWHMIQLTRKLRCQLLWQNTGLMQLTLSVLACLNILLRHGEHVY